MILKLKRGTNWLYIDNVVELTVENAKMGLDVKNESPEVTLVYSRYSRTGVIEQIAIDCNDSAFLLNDSGRTVERLI